MRQLILVRHAAPAREYAVPAREWPLSPAGRADAERLAHALVPYAPAVIVASDEPKAQETAQPLADRLGLTVHVSAGLREHERRSVGYLGAEAFQAAVARFFAEPDALVFGEETAQQALARFSAAVDEALARFPDGSVALFAHGTVLSLFVAAHSDVGPMTFWRDLGLPAWVIFTLPDRALAEIHMRLSPR